MVASVKAQSWNQQFLENVPENAKIHKDEVFGPTVNLYSVKTIDEAIEKANSLPFGLHAAVFTADVNTAF